MRLMATQHLKIRKEGDGYFRAQWIDNAGCKHRRSFGTNRTKAQNRFAAFHHRWQRDPAVRNPGAGGPVTVQQAWELFEKHADAHYRHADGTPTGEAENLGYAFAKVLELFGDTPAAEFGPRRLKEARVELVRDGLCRNTINARVRKIRQVFKWLVEEERVPAEVWHSLQAVQALDAGRAVNVGDSDVVPVERDPVSPVPDYWVWNTCDHLPPSVRAMVELQYWTGCRPQDVCNLTSGAVETTGKVWIYRPAKHKTQHHGKARQVLLGPKAQEILKPYLLPQLDQHCFSPALAMTERWDARVVEYSPKNKGDDYRRWPSYQKRREQRDVARFADRWDPKAYANVIRQASKRNDLAPWSPNRLRHNAATRIRKGFGLDVAQVVLGHSSADVTQVYAEVDLAKAISVMEQVG